MLEDLLKVLECRLDQSALVTRELESPFLLLLFLRSFCSLSVKVRSGSGLSVGIQSAKALLVRADQVKHLLIGRKTR